MPAARREPSVRIQQVAHKVAHAVGLLVETGALDDAAGGGVRRV